MPELKHNIHIDLMQQQIQNAAFQTLGGPPSTPSLGQFYFNTATKKPMLWSGTDWLDMAELHATYATTTIPGAPMTGATVFSSITLDNGHITNTTVRNLTAADIGASTAVHTHAFTDILGIPSQTILGNNTGTTGTAQALTAGDVLTLLGIAYGNASYLITTPTDTVQRTWSAKMLGDYITSRLGTYITVVNLALGVTTSTTQPITNSAGTGFTLPSATTTLAGLMSAADKLKLNGIAVGANNYSHPTDNPGVQPFATELTSGVQILSQITVNTQGHVTTIKGRNLTAADLAPVIFNNASNSATNQTWTASKIYAELQAAITQVTTGALVYQNNGYTPSGTQGTVTAPTPQAGGAIKTGMVWVVGSAGWFGNQAVEAGDMIIAKIDSAGATEGNYQVVNKNIPAIVSATEFIEGIIYLASESETILGTNTTKAVTPAGLKAALLSYTGGYYTTFGNGSGTSFNFNHGLGTDKVIVQTRITALGKPVLMEAYADATKVYLNMNVAPATGEYAVLVTKI